MRSVAHHQRPVSERVRRNWRDHEALDVGHENGAAGGERIRSRTGCRRNNQAVSLITGDENLINEDVAVVEPGNGTLPDHNVVEGVKGGDDRAATTHLAMHHRANVNAGGTPINAIQGRIEFVERHFGQKSQSAKVHAHNWDAGLRNRARRREKGAVSAKHNDKIQLPRTHCFAGDGFRGFSEGGCFWINNECVAVTRKPLRQVRHNLRDFRLAWFGNDAYGFLRWRVFCHEDGIVQVLFVTETQASRSNKSEVKANLVPTSAF